MNSGTIVSIAFFNFAGISVTKQISATTRTVLDSIRTFVIWIFSLLIKWQEFNGIQLLGFIVLMLGMFLYNNVIIRPFLIQKGIIKSDEYNEDIRALIRDEENADTHENASQNNVEK